MEHFLLIGNNFFNRNHLHPNDSTCKISACISFPCRSTHSQTLCKLEKTILHLQAVTVESRSKTLNSETMVKPPKNKLGTDHVSTRAPSLSILWVGFVSEKSHAIIQAALKIINLVEPIKFYRETAGLGLWGLKHSPSSTETLKIKLLKGEERPELVTVALEAPWVTADQDPCWKTDSCWDNKIYHSSNRKLRRTRRETERGECGMREEWGDFPSALGLRRSLTWDTASFRPASAFVYGTIAFPSPRYVFISKWPLLCY